MRIYLVALLLTIVLANILTNDKVKLSKGRTGKINHLNVFISFLPLFIVSLFRWNVGVDVVYGSGYYYKAYYAVQNAIGNIFGYELGFYLYMKICNFVRLNLYLFYCSITVLFFIYITKFIADNSKCISLSAIIFVFSDLYLFSYSTLRQTLGIAFALYPITKMLKEEKYYKKVNWWVMMLISISMHNTIIYMYLILLLAKHKIEEKKLILITFFGCILSPFASTILSKIVSMTSYFQKYYNSNMFENSFTITYFLIALLLFIISMINYKKIIDNNERNYMLINVCAYTTILMANSKLLIMPYRVFPLFVPFYVVLCSKIIENIKKGSVKYMLTYIYIIVPFILLYVNQYYIGNGATNFNYKCIFDYSNQVWGK